ncbi:MAG TPA: lipid A deacylase LpxR family protein [Gemmatimonadaceae bacterium]|nr:lipid A deacylase LpxR family protein [Gemmatimonadaceae bacterium]
MRVPRSAALLLLAALAGAAAPALLPAQTWRSAARSASLTEENDAFRDSDSAYTQGLRLMTSRGWFPDKLRQPKRFAASSRLLSTMAWLSPLALHRPQRAAFGDVRTSCLGFNDFDCASTFLGLSQTQYTPADIGTDTLITGDRPYAGLLALTAGHTLLLDRSSFRAQLDLGVSGRPSLARETQTLAHWTWSPGAARPRGWQHQLRASPHLQATTQYAITTLTTCDDGEWFCDGWALDNSLRTETSLGTVMGRLSQGTVVRFGYNMPRLEGSDRITVTAPPLVDRLPARFWFTVYGTADARAVGWNTLIEGTRWRDGGARGWWTLNEVSVRRGLAEWSVGGSAGGRWGGASLQWVSRSSEYRPYGGRHDYASFTIFLLRPQVASGGG